MSVTEPEEVRIPTAWGHVSAKCWGNPRNFPILGIHGWMDNAGTFDRLVPLLSRRFYFVAIEIPGHGRSSNLPPGIPYHFGDGIITLRKIVTQYFKWGRFSILGHSMGGGWGSLFASLYPDQIDKLVMLDVIKPFSNEEGITPRNMMQSIEYLISLEEKQKQKCSRTYSYEEAVQQLISATDGSLSVTAAKSLMPRGTIKVGENKVSFRADARLQVTPLYQFSHAVALNILKGMRCHLLIIRAKDAPPYEVSKEEFRAMMDNYRERCASFEYVEVEGNHYVHLNEPHSVAGLINKFLLAENEK